MPEARGGKSVWLDVVLSFRGSGFQLVSSCVWRKKRHVRLALPCLSCLALVALPWLPCLALPCPASPCWAYAPRTAAGGAPPPPPMHPALGPRRSELCWPGWPPARSGPALAFGGGGALRGHCHCPHCQYRCHYIRHPVCFGCLFRCPPVYKHRQAVGQWAVGPRGAARAKQERRERSKSGGVF
jgi:hypothetical protein